MNVFCGKAKSFFVFVIAKKIRNYAALNQF